MDPADNLGWKRLAISTHHKVGRQTLRAHTVAGTFELFWQQEPGMLQHCHRRGVLNTILVGSACWNLPASLLQDPHAHLRVVIAASIRLFCLQQLFYTSIDAAWGFEEVSGSKEASTDTFCGSLPQTHVCAGKPVQSNTCSGTISSLIVMSLDC